MSFRTFLDSLQHDAYFCRKEEREDDYKEEEGGLNGSYTYAGHRRLGRKQALDDPWLATHFGYNPTCLTGQVYQWNTPQSYPLEPSHGSELSFPFSPKDEYHQRQEETS